VLPSVTPTLTAEIARMGWTLTPLGGGYGRIDGAVYSLYVIATDEVSQAEHDEFLELFSRRELEVSDATRWLGDWLKEKRMTQPDVTQTESFEEIMERVLQAMPIEKRLGRAKPEEVLVALPIEILRALSQDYILSLTPETQEKIQRRLQDDPH
jgi:hypothetical protein